MERLLTVKQLSDSLQISCRTVYEWVHLGFIPHYKLPKGVRFREAEIRRWLMRRKKRGRTKYKISVDYLG